MAFGKIDIVSGTKLMVTVEQSLPDLLLVTYKNELKTFQGMLLESSKG